MRRGRRLSFYRIRLFTGCIWCAIRERLQLLVRYGTDRKAVRLERHPSLAACPLCPCGARPSGRQPSPSGPAAAPAPVDAPWPLCGRPRSALCVEGCSVRARSLVPWGPGSPRGGSFCSRGRQSMSRQQRGVPAGLCSGARGRGRAVRGTRGLCRSPSCRPSPVTGVGLLGPHISQTATSSCPFLTGPVSWEPEALPPPGACGLAELRAAG